MYSKAKLILIYLLSAFLILTNFYQIISLILGFEIVWKVIMSIFLLGYTVFCVYLIRVEIKDFVDEFDEDLIKQEQETI